MMGVLTIYTTFRERGSFLLALDKDKAGIDPDNVWRISSQLKRYVSGHEHNCFQIVGCMFTFHMLYIYNNRRVICWLC